MRKFLITALVASTMSLIGIPESAAQEDAVQERVVVTGTRLSRGNAGGGYQIYKRITADFILVDVYYQSGTRDETTRFSELKTMFDRLVAADRTNDGIFLQGGSDYGRVPLETILFEEILEEDYDNDDILKFTLTLGIEVNGEKDFEKVLARGQAFINSIPLSGRAESYLDDTQYIGARNVNAYRPEILKRIAEEVNKLKGIFGPSEVSVSGFGSELETATTGPLQLDVYLPYSISITTK